MAFPDVEAANTTANHPAPPRRDDLEPIPAPADDELREVFAIEADELLSNVEANLRALFHSPSNEHAMWEMRSSLHTYKGAAGMVGAPGHSAVAHKIEDLLAWLSGNGKVPNEAVLDAIASASAYLRSTPPAQGQEFRGQCRRLDLAISELSSTGGCGIVPEAKATPADRVDPPNSARRVVRVSVDRLNGLAEAARDLAAGLDCVEQSFAELSRSLDRLEPAIAAPAMIENLRVLSERLAADMSNHRRLVNATAEHVTQIRLISFGSIFTRIERSMLAACEEEGKAAEFVMNGKDVQLDTDLVNYLVEPVMHLVRNAVVHGIEDPETRRMLGKPHIGRIEVNVRDTGPHVELTVCDDGEGVDGAALRENARGAGIATMPGVPLEELNILDLVCLRGLTTAPRLTTNAGRGIGMSIVREGVETRGGRLAVDSRPLLGTTFTITLPQLARDPFSRDRTVLIVDDSAASRYSTARLLTDLGFRVELACDGEEAIGMLNSSPPPAVVLADVEMPRMNGFDLATEVRRGFPGQPIVLMSSRQDQAMRERAAQLGVVEFLSKPLAAEKLSIALSRCLPARV